MKKTMYIYMYISLFSVFGYSSPIWQRKIINYERSQYKAGFQNWMITQAENGWLYCANSNGLLEFDGINWALYSAQSTIIRSVKIVDNRIYVGGSSEFGYFERNDIGFQEYVSLSREIKGWGGEVWNILNIGDNIYFISDVNIHIFNIKNKSIRNISSEFKIDCSTVFEGKLYIGTSDGVFYLNDNHSLVLLPLSLSLRGYKIVSMLPYNSKLLITTRQNGLFYLEFDRVAKITSTADSFVANNQLFSASISGSKVALGSVQNGVFIFDLQNPSYKEGFNIANGLENNTILCSFFDKDHNLWMGQDKGLGYIDLNSPIRPLFSTVSSIGTGYCSAIYNNELYFGTNQGLYKIDNLGNYQLIKGSEGQIWSMTIIDNSLFCSGDNGITVFSATAMYKINLPGAWAVRSLSSNKEALIVGTYSSLYILVKKNDKWIFSHRVLDFNDSTKGFIEDQENNSFWIAASGHNIQRIIFDPDFSRVISRKNYTLGGAVFEGNSSFCMIDNMLTICSRNGIFKYSRITDSFDPYVQLESKLEGRKFYRYLSIDKFKNIWFVSGNELKYLPYEQGGYQKQIYNIGLTDELIDDYENIFMADSANAIIAVGNAFVKLDLQQLKKQKPHKVNTYIRKLVSSKTDSVICYGVTDKKIILPHSLNSIRIYFAGENYSSSSDILYSYRLKGVDDEWSIPTTETSKEYTNLYEGEYTFEVKSLMNGNTIEVNIASMKFTVLPPWYRSILAYVFYFLLSVVLLFIIYKKTISKQKKMILQKGEELIAQTKRYEEETKIKDQEIYELQNEKLKSELNYKTQELTGYILNVIRKNEMLEDVKKSALSISKAIDDENQPNIIRQRVVRLIGQVNSNIEHDSDFEMFKSNFDLIHQDFFKLLDEKYPGLTRNDKILCAYLNMNLSSKEIAPLLNISLRGVEVNRYRLRKKLNLGRDTNLTDYLKSLK